MTAAAAPAALLYQPGRPGRVLRIAEQRPPLSEAELARIWAAQSFPAEALALVDGRRLRVLQPGRGGGGAGPDFRDALIEIEGEQRRGDVELHLRASFFQSHGHHRDPAYNRLALHVVFEADDGPDTQLQDGGRVPVAAFAPWLSRRRAEMNAWLAAEPLWAEPCRQAPQRLGQATIAGLLTAEGERRLRLKTARLRDGIAAVGDEEALWGALLEGMGYGGDRAAWRRLAQALPVALARRLADSRPEGLEAGLLATAGLAEAPEELAALLSPPLTPGLSGGSRPANRPERRLRALSRLWQRAEGDLPAFALQGVREAAGASELEACWQVGNPAGGAALLGGQRARELLLNAVLPFAAALEPWLTEQALRLAGELPAAPPYGKTRFLENNLRGESGRRPARSALQQQGLLALQANWCSQGGCGRCPLSG